jgi:chlorobactene glucosyltransferase
MISRTAYDAIGRHSCVQSNILDDVGIARALIQANRSYHCLYLHELFRCRMYTTFSEIWEGWTKNIFAGLRYSLINVLSAILFVFAFSILGHMLFVLGALRLVSVELMLWGTAIMCACQLVRLVMDWRRGMNILYGLTHSPASLLVIGIIIHSAIRSLRGTVTWKGRTYKPKG